MSSVLIVDDAAFMRMMIRDILEQNNFHVVAEAKDGMSAIEQYKKYKPDIVTMDITMPDMDGIKTVEEIKKIDSGAKIIMCTAMGQQAMVIDAIRAGAKDFIVKPFEESQVLEAINKVIG